MKILILVLSMFFCQISFGSFSGKWKGAGRGESDIGWNSLCSNVELDIFQTESEFSIKSAEILCESNFNVSFEILNLKIIGKKLFMNEKQVGTILSDEVKIDVNAINRLKNKKSDEKSIIELKLSSESLEFIKKSESASYNLKITAELKH